MQDIFHELKDWQETNRLYALATVIRTWGSAPRMVGASMAITTEQDIVGSVSGGCIEGAVIQAAQKVMQTGEGKRLSFGVTHEDAWTVGLSCGGEIEVYVEKGLAISEDEGERTIWKGLREAVEHSRGAVLLSRMDEGERKHLLVLANGEVRGGPMDRALVQKALQVYRERKNQPITAGSITYFAWVFPPKSQLFIIGAAHITAELVALANEFDFETIVIDPRGIFTDKTHFPSPPTQLMLAWPEEVLSNYTFDPYTYAVVLTHDPKIDDQALSILLPTDLAYIGALGSKKTHAKRVKRLQEAGFDDQLISKIKGPVGIDIKAKRPKEIALSIVAQMIQERNAYL